MKAELEKKIVKIGRSKGVIIPPLFLKLLDLDLDNNIILSLEDNKIIIRKK
ncbi:hypothetical protein IJ596_01240 [bacterium]|nr:hypothetical protein [bacterium]